MRVVANTAKSLWNLVLTWPVDSLRYFLTLRPIPIGLFNFAHRQPHDRLLASKNLKLSTGQAELTFHTVWTESLATSHMGLCKISQYVSFII